MLQKINEQRIEPHKVTKPIQLLAAWMVGLVVTNSTFLIAASQMTDQSWEKGFLVVAAVINVPIFLFALFLLQTRFRAELQEDTYYSEYLSKKTATTVRVDKISEQDSKIDRLERTIVQFYEKKNTNDEVNGNNIILDWGPWAVGLNRLHPNFKAIRRSLQESNIPLSVLFGNHEDVPEKWIVSISYRLPTTHKTALLKSLISHGLDGFVFWNPVREAEENEDVYIGSYGDRSSYIPFNNELSLMLEGPVEEIDFEIFIEEHAIKRK